MKQNLFFGLSQKSKKVSFYFETPCKGEYFAWVIFWEMNVARFARYNETFFGRYCLYKAGIPRIIRLIALRLFSPTRHVQAPRKKDARALSTNYIFLFFSFFPGAL